MPENKNILAFRQLDQDPQAVPEDRATNRVRIRLGSARLANTNVAQLSPGSVFVLDRAIDETVEVLIRGQVVAVGRVVVARGKLAVEICEVRRPHRRAAA